jgi:D-alanyl-D-alanine carboxypeptidase
VIAEALGGSEEEFAKAMTRKARALGMTRTVYKNASGLPDDDQVTSARDQALLGMAIQDRYPKYYRYFSTSSFAWRGVSIRNHNRLLGRVEGVDGIKTGFTRASGFNLVTSVKRGKRHLVAVVLGGRSGGARDARMRELISAHVDEGATTRTAPRVGRSGGADGTAAGKGAHCVRRKTYAASEGIRAADSSDAAVGQCDHGGHRARATRARLDRSDQAEPRQDPCCESERVSGPHRLPRLAVVTVAGDFADACHGSLLPTEIELPPPPPAPSPACSGVLSTQAHAAPAVPQKATASYASAGAPSVPITAPTPAVQTPASPAPLPVSSENRVRSGWIIQVGAYEDIAEAREKLTTARSMAANLLHGSDPFYRGRDQGRQEALPRALSPG